jgi:hypothetical protein
MIRRYDVEGHAAKLWPGKEVRWIGYAEIDGVAHWHVQLEGEMRPRTINAETGEEV